MSTPRDLADTILKMQGINIVEIIDELAVSPDDLPVVGPAQRIKEEIPGHSPTRDLCCRLSRFCSATRARSLGDRTVSAPQGGP